MTLDTEQPEVAAATTRHQGAKSARRADGAATGTRWVTATAAVLAAAASALGLLTDNVYAGAASTAEMLRAYDLVTLILVVPAFVVAFWAARRGSARAGLVVLSLVAYFVYTYAYYLFGSGFNDLFLLHAIVMATSVVALVLNLATLDVTAFADRARVGFGFRGAAAVLGVLAVALGGMWTYFAADNAFTGDVPAGSQLVETDTIVHLGMALDLTLLVPLYAAAALLLWRRTRWGFVLGVVAVLAGLLHQVSYIVAMPFQVAADIPGAVAVDPGEPFIVLVYLLGAVLLLRRPRSGVEKPGSPEA
jgi:hypothetical protein